MKRHTYLKNLLIMAFLPFTIACSEPPVVVERPATKRAPETATDDQQRKTFRDHLVLLLEQENFAELEKIAHEVTTKKERFPGGDWKLSRFYEAIGYTPTGPKKVDRTDYRRRISKIRKWIEQKPNSIYANIALGEAQIGYAWQHRGSGFADTVGDQQFGNFHKLLKDADTTLNKMKDRANECVAWYRAKQRIGLGIGWDRTEMMNLLNAGSSIEPLYYEIYSGHAYYLLPRWYGSPGEWEAFTVDSVLKISKTEGLQEANILYSDICWHMSRFYSDFFQKNKVNWKGIKQGFMDRQQKYGSSIHYLNAFCHMAGSASDKTTTKALMLRIGDRWDPDLWTEKKYFDGYKKWAFEAK